jgi:hypothetical protein
MGRQTARGLASGPPRQQRQPNQHRPASPHQDSRAQAQHLHGADQARVLFGQIGQGFGQFALGLGVALDLALRGDQGVFELHQWLTAEAPGILGSKAIKWNFTKFLVGRDGRVIKRYAPQDSPEKMAKDIEAALAA